MNPLILLLPTPPASYKPLHPALYPALTAVFPLIVATLLTVLLTPKEPVLFTPSSNATYLESVPPFPQTFSQIAAVHPLSAGVLVSDHETNGVYLVSRSAPIAVPFLPNAGGTNETHSVKLRRPGISAFAELGCDSKTCNVVVTRHAARDVAVLPVSQLDELVPTTGMPKRIADSHNGTSLNAPHALHVDFMGNVFFADAYYGLVEQADEFDRKLDDPPDKTFPQNIYYLPAEEVHRAMRVEAPAEPILLVENIDRPSGLAVSRDGRLFVAQASPRRAVLLEYELVQVEATIKAHSPVVVFDWTGALHSWGEAWYKCVLGNIALDGHGRLFVGAGDGIAVFDVRARARGMGTPVGWISVDVPPGPPRVAYEEGWLYIGASSRVGKIRVGSRQQ